MIITKDNIRKNEPFLIKWTDGIYDDKNSLKPGFRTPAQSDEFLTRLDKETSILKDSRFIKMESIEENIEHLRVRARLQNMRKLSQGTGRKFEGLEELEETKPSFYRAVLKAIPFTAYTFIPKTFLLENIEKTGFLNRYESMLIPSCAYSSEAIGVYGKNTNEGKDGIYSMDGLLKQLENVKKYKDANPNQNDLPSGLYNNINLENSIVEQIMKMIFEFSKQGGKLENARIKVPTMLKGQIFKEVGERKTNKGDEVYFDGRDVRIFNVPVEAAHVLDHPENGYRCHMILGDFDSFAFGYLNEMESENTYEHNKKAYLTSVDVHFGCVIIHAEDLLAAPIGTPKDANNDSYGPSTKKTGAIKDEKSDK